MFRIEYSPKLECATWVASAVRGIATLWLDDEARLYQLELVVAEAANNAAEYSQSNSFVLIEKGESAITLEFQSQGLPIELNLERLSDCIDFDPEDVDSVADSGRGFFLLQSLAKELSVTHDQGVNRVRFKFLLEPLDC